MSVRFLKQQMGEVTTKDKIIVYRNYTTRVMVKENEKIGDLPENNMQN